MKKLFVVLTVLILISIFSYSEYFHFSNVGIFLEITPSVKERILFSSKCECRKKEVVSVDLFSNGNYLIQSSNSQLNVRGDDFERLNFTCDLYNEFRRGKNQKVIGYSLYGKNQRYYNLLKKLSASIKKFYPEWTMRVYYDDTINEAVICESECLKDETGRYLDNTDFCSVRKMPFRNSLNKTWDANYMHSMFWRWFPIGDSFVDAFQSRDLDSHIVQREVDSTNVWITSNKPGHIMRDHPQHVFAILGGMWSFFNSRDRNLANHLYALFTDYNITINYNKNLKSDEGRDQDFLKDYVYAFMKNISITHDSYHCTDFNYSAPFPTKRMGNCFIGGVGGECDPKARFTQCPVECRPEDHKNWLNC